MSVVLKRFAKNFKKLRKERMTQEQFAEKKKFSVRYVQRLESKNPPNVSLKTVESLAKVLKVDVSELLKKK